MIELYDIVDSNAYIQSNCYQSQLTKTLDSDPELRIIRIELDNLKQLLKGSNVLSRLKLRTVSRNIDKLNVALKDTNLFVYEQDPWDNFRHVSPYYGVYNTIKEKLPLVTFLNTSHWWSEKINEVGIPSKFVQMWMNPEMCADDVRWSQKEHDVIFCGTLYPYRRAFFNSLSNEGIDVKIIPPGRGYTDYLNLLSKTKISIRSERTDWVTDFGTLTDPNALWIRDIECAARGCFSMREFDDEGPKWGIGQLPVIRPFRSIEDAAAQIKEILALKEDEANSIISTSVDKVRQMNMFTTVPNTIKDIIRSQRLNT